MLTALSDQRVLDSITAGMGEEAAAQMLEDLASMREEAASGVISSLTAKDTGKNWTNTSPLVPALFGNKSSLKTKDIYLGKSKETGAEAIFSLLSGYITPYENEIIDCVTKFRRDGQVTEDGRIYFSLGQLFRAMRHGAGSTCPTQAQQAALAADLEALRRDITFKLNEPLKVWGNFIATGGTYPILQFAKVFGRKINGNEIDTMYIVSNDMNIVNDISERLHMGQSVSQEVKAIKKDGKPWKMYKRQVAIRNYLWNRILSYIGARASGKNYSPCIPYSSIFEVCEIGSNRETQKRSKDDIATILNYWQQQGILESWQEYTNTDSRKPDGVQIRIPEKYIEG